MEEEESSNGETPTSGQDNDNEDLRNMMSFLVNEMKTMKMQLASVTGLDVPTHLKTEEDVDHLEEEDRDLESTVSSKLDVVKPSISRDPRA